MGQVTVRDLAASEPVQEIIIADLSKERAERLKQRISSPKIKCVRADLADADSMKAALSGADVLINCTPYKFNVQVMEAALASGCHYLDLGGLFHVTRKQLELHERFKDHKLLAVLGMGAAPGMTNVMAAHAATHLDQVEAIDMTVAGVDFVKTDHPLLPPYALETILDEYAMEPMVFEDGRFVAKPPMSGEMDVDMPEPVGNVKAFLTLHSEIATLPLAYQHKGVKRVTYRLGLPEEFHDRMKFLVELGFGDTKTIKVDDQSVHPRRMLQAMIDQHAVPDADPDDCEVVRVDVAGLLGGRRTVIRMESTIRSDDNWKVSCGALDTGVPPSIVAQMIGLGVIQSRGVMAPESCVPPELFFLELSKRGIIMRRVTDETMAENGGRSSVRPSPRAALSRSR